MQARFMIERPDDVQATVRLTMRVSDWCKLRDQLADLGTPSFGVLGAVNLVGEMKDAITDLLAKVREVYYAEQEL